MNNQHTAPSQVYQYKGLAFLRLLMASNRNPVNALYQAMLKHGNTIEFKLKGERMVFFFHPDGVQAVLKDQAKDMHKAPNYREFKPLFGDGLFTLEDEEWKKHRRIMAPEFHTDHFEGFSKVIAEEINRLERALETSAKTGEPRDLLADMLEIIFRIAVRVFVGINLEEDMKVVNEAFNYPKVFIANQLASPIKWPNWMPSPARKKVKACLNVLDDMVYKMIDQQQLRVDCPASHNAETNVLLRMIRAGAKDKENYLSHRQLRDEVVTIFAAAHDTSSTALTWTFLYLMQEKEIAQKMLEEVQAVLRGNNAQLANIPQLTYTNMVLKESMRLKSPSYGMARTPIKPLEITGIPVYPGETLYLSPYITHRHPDFWENPLKFNPERFTAEAIKNRHFGAYFPFAKGPRVCLGENFAMMEIMLILPSLFQKFEFSLVNPSKPIKEHCRITLSPKGKVMVKVKKR